MLKAEYGYCTAKNKCENVLNDVVKFTNVLWVSLVIPYIAIRMMEDIVLCGSEYVNSYRRLK